jgi:hypothetical protein
MQTSFSANDLLSRRGYRDFADAVGKLDAEADAEAKRWILADARIGVVSTVFRSIGAFRRSYFGEGYRKMGVPGLFLAVNDGMRPFLAYAKYWEVRSGAIRKGIPL